MNSEGAPAPILKQGLLRKFRWYLSPALLAEYNEVLARARLKLNQHQIARLLRDLRQTVVLVTPRKRVQIATDPDDDKVIECALAGRADFIVTGNIRHFPEQFQDILVVGPRKFIEILASVPDAA
jgi:putative PIN family toxin of toxin-antitoxin system